MYQRTFPVIVLIFAFLIGLSSSLRCYECTGEECVTGSLVEKDCGSESEYCLKLKLDGVVTRACAYDAPLNGEVGCRNFKDDETCHCQGNLCNGGTTLTYSLLAIGAAALVAHHL